MPSYHISRRKVARQPDRCAASLSGVVCRIRRALLGAVLKFAAYYPDRDRSDAFFVCTS